MEQQTASGPSGQQPTPVFENGCEQQVADASHDVGEVAFGQACQGDAAVAARSARGGMEACKGATRRALGSRTTPKKSVEV